MFLDSTSNNRITLHVAGSGTMNTKWEETVISLNRIRPNFSFSKKKFSI